MVSACKLLVFYPLWLCAILFFLTAPEENVQDFESNRIIIGDPLIATEITKEPKLMSRWMGADRLVHKITTAYVDEHRVKRHLINLDLPTGQGLPHILTNIFSQTNQNSPERLQMESRFYVNNFLYDADYNITFTGGRNNERFSQLTSIISYRSVHPIWSLILRVGRLEQEYFYETALYQLSKEIREQYEKKMELIRDFTLEEDEELYESVMKSTNSGNDPLSILEQANYDI